MLDHEIKKMVFTAMQKVVDAGNMFMGSTSLAIAAEVITLEGMNQFQPADIERFVHDFCWKDEVAKVEAFIQEGNMLFAKDRIDMWLPDIQFYILRNLSIKSSMALLEYELIK